MGSTNRDSGNFSSINIDDPETPETHTGEKSSLMRNHDEPPMEPDNHGDGRSSSLLNYGDHDEPNNSEEHNYEPDNNYGESQNSEGENSERSRLLANHDDPLMNCDEPNAPSVNNETVGGYKEPANSLKHQNSVDSEVASHYESANSLVQPDEPPCKDAKLDNTNSLPNHNSENIPNSTETHNAETTQNHNHQRRRVRGSILKQKKRQTSIQLPEGDDVHDDDQNEHNHHNHRHSSSRPSVFIRLQQHRPSLFALPRRRQPCTINCCSRRVQWPKLLTWSKCCEQKVEDDEEIEDEPFRKRCSRMFFTFVYCLLAGLAVFVTYSMIQDLITSMQYPVRSIRYTKVTEYDAPGIAVYGGSARFLACGYYYNNVVLSKVRVSQLDLENLTCNFTELNYIDPHYPDVERHVTIMRGPISFVNREAIFLHFELNDETRDFFTVSYFVFPGYDEFVKLNSTAQGERMVAYHRYSPTFALSAGLRMWIKLSMFESHLMDGVKHTEFSVEYSVVKYHDTREASERDNHLFFIFFEWKNDIIEQSYLIYSTTPWSVGAGLCGMFLMLHKGYQLSHTSYTRLQKDKERRMQRKRTIRERRQSRAALAMT